MSKEQANAFKKHRDADDVQGNLGWAARMQTKALRAGQEALARIDVEREFGLSDAERVLWRLMKIPRKYMDLEHTGLLPVDKLRGFLRGLVAADALDIVEANEGKALVPAEVRRVKAEIEGKEIKGPSGLPLRPKVYRPDISGATPAPATPAPEPTPAQPTPSALQHAPARPTPSPVQHTPARPTPSPVQHTPARPTPSPVQHTPARSTPSPLADDDAALKASIERAWTAMQKQNHYEFLGVMRSTTDEGVRSAYVQLAREYHPDKVAGTSLANDPAIVGKIDDLFKRLQDAQQALATQDARASYERTLEALGSGGATSGGKVRRPVEAQNAFKMGDTFFKRRDYKQAEAHFRQASNFDPEDPKIATALAYCIWLNPDHDEKTRTAEARKRLTEVVNKHRHGDAAYKLGLLLRKEGDEQGALRNIKLAVQLDPHHLEATREVRLFTMRQEEKKREDKGLLGKFLKK